MKWLRVALVVAMAMAIVPSVVAQNPPKIVVYLGWDSLQHSPINISFDDVRAAELRPGRFFVINATPGSHVLVAGTGIPMVVNAQAQGNVFLRVGRQIEFGPSGKIEIPSLEKPPADQAELELRNLVYIGPKKIFSAAVSKDDPFSGSAPRLRSRNSDK